VPSEILTAVSTSRAPPWSRQRSGDLLAARIAGTRVSLRCRPSHRTSISTRWSVLLASEPGRREARAPGRR